MGIIERVRAWKLKRDVRRAVKVLIRFDKAMSVHPHWKRKQFWRDFVRSDRLRNGFLRTLPGLFGE